MKHFQVITLLLLSFLFALPACKKDKEADEVPATHKEEMVDVGGYQLFTRISGKKSPAIVLIGGFGGDTNEWSAVEKDFAEIALVVNYDREGLGKSTWQMRPKDSETIARELHALLSAKNIPKPYVLVAHSLGGIHARVYTSLYKSEVAGLLLIDPTAEDVEETILATLPPDEAENLRQEILKAEEETAQNLPEGGVREEFKAIRTCYEQVRGLNVTTNAPFAIISSMKTETNEPLEQMSKEVAKALRDQLLQQMGTGPTKHYITNEAGHYVQLEQPTLVLEAVNWILSNI